MLTSCRKCGRIHKRGMKCPNVVVPDRAKSPTETSRFRGTRAWRKLSLEVRKRDKQLCQVCLQNKYHTQFIYNFRNLEVHHIIPIHEDWSRKLDMSNCITLCRFHHELAEEGTISKRELFQILEKGEKHGTEGSRKTD